jgi:endonuclease V-like protein UPF0215 family
MDPILAMVHIIVAFNVVTGRQVTQLMQCPAVTVTPESPEISDL